MNFSRIPLLIALVAVLSGPAILSAQTRPTEITGSIYKDNNRNGKFDGSDVHFNKKTKIYLYRVLPNGTRKKIGVAKTNSKGKYTFQNQPSGTYFVTARMGKKLAVRTSNFKVTGVGRSKVTNIPLVTRQTIKDYGFLSVTANPGNLDNASEGSGGGGGGDVSPFAP